MYVQEYFADTGDGFGTRMKPAEPEPELEPKPQGRAAVRKEPMEAKTTQPATSEPKRRKLTDSSKVIIKDRKNIRYGRDKKKETTEFLVFCEKEKKDRWVSLWEMSRIMNGV